MRALYPYLCRKAKSRADGGIVGTREDHDIYEWRHRYDGWHIIDLTLFGGHTWYYTGYAVRSSGDGVSRGAALDAVPAPVIEVQSVIRN